MSLIYCDLDEPKIIEEIFYKGYRAIIKTLGSHPCVYVEIPKSNKLYGVNYMNIYLDSAHGGITFTGSFKDDDSYYIGWDFAHYGDYYFSKNNISLCINGKEWTIQELRQQAKDVIEEILELKKFQYKKYYFAKEDKEY